MSTNTHLVVFTEINDKEEKMAEIFANSRNNVVIDVDKFNILEITKEDWPEIKGFIDATFKILNNGEEIN
jgi:hypothetical protein